MEINFLPHRDDRVVEWYDLNEEVRVFVRESYTSDNPDDLQVEILMGEEDVWEETTDEGLKGAYKIVADFVADLVDEDLF